MCREFLPNLLKDSAVFFKTLFVLSFSHVLLTILKPSLLPAAAPNQFLAVSFSLGLGREEKKKIIFRHAENENLHQS